MIVHLIHDSDGNIQSVILQTMEIEGELEINSDQDGVLVTVVDLSEIFADTELERDAETRISLREHGLLARDIRSRFRVNTERGTLEERE